MKVLIRFTLSLLVFWFVVFVPCRIFFTLYQWPIGNRIQHSSEIAEAFFQAYPLDLATAIVLVGLPMLGAWFYFLFKRKFWLRFIVGTVLVELILYTMVALMDAGIYREWLAKVNMQALSHFINPKEIVATVPWHLQLIFILGVIGYSWLFFQVYRKWIGSIIPRLQSEPPNALYAILFLLVVAGLSVIGIRGGIMNLPISQSVVYFSSDVLANDIAVNPLYNLLQDITVQDQTPTDQEYVTLTDPEANELCRLPYIIAQDSTIPILTSTRPNLVFLVLESWSSDMVGFSGGVKGITPNLDSLSTEGIVFTNAVASAYISDQGIPALFSGWPGLHKISAINRPHRIVAMPSLPEVLEKYGYQTSFSYGGDLVFGNIKGYVVQKKFQTIRDMRFYTNLPQGKLGVHDQDMLPVFLAECNQMKSPFFSVLFTLSTHMPYDYQSKKKYRSPIPNDCEANYTASIQYADEALGNFFKEAKKQTWYDQTLFVLVADHSHNTYLQHDMASVNRHKIPMLFLGGAISKEFRGRVFSNWVGQTDLPSTLLHQLKLNESVDFKWSRDMFNPYTTSCAYFPFFGGSGFVSEKGVASYRAQYKTTLVHTKNATDSAQLVSTAKAFLQNIYLETIKGPQGK